MESTTAWLKEECVGDLSHRKIIDRKGEIQELIQTIGIDCSWMTVLTWTSLDNIGIMCFFQSFQGNLQNMLLELFF